MHTKIYLIFFLLVSLYVGCKSVGESEDPLIDVKETRIEINPKAAWLNLYKPLDTTYLNSKFKLLFFFRIDDPTLPELLPKLNELSRANPTLLIIGVHSPKFIIQKNETELKDLLTAFDFGFPLLNDPEFEMWNRLNIRGWSSFVLLDPSGRISARFTANNLVTDLPITLAEKTKTLKQRLALDTLSVSRFIRTDNQTSYLLSRPSCIIFDKTKSMLFISDAGNHRIVAIDTAGNIKFVIGSGRQGNKSGRFELAELNRPSYLYLDDDSRILYICEQNNNTLKTADLITHTISPLSAGNDVAFFNIAKKKINYQLKSPGALTKYMGNFILSNFDTHNWLQSQEPDKSWQIIAGNSSQDLKDSSFIHASFAQTSAFTTIYPYLYFVDKQTSSLRRWDGKYISTLIGKGLFEFGLTDGKKNKALMQAPSSLTSLSNNIYITDTYNSKIRVYNIIDSLLSTLPDSGFMQDIMPAGICTVGEKLFFTDLKKGKILTFNTVTNKFSELTLHHLDKLMERNETASSPTLINYFQILPGQGILRFEFDSNEQLQIIPDELNRFEIASTNKTALVLGKQTPAKDCSFQIPYIAHTDESEIKASYCLYVYDKKNKSYQLYKNEVHFYLKTNSDPFAITKKITLQVN